MSVVSSEGDIGNPSVLSPPVGYINLKNNCVLPIVLFYFTAPTGFILEMTEVAKVGEIDVAIKPVAKADILLIAQAFGVKKIDGTPFKPADTLTSFTERFNELITNGEGIFRTIRQHFLNDTEELAIPTGRMSFAFPTVITEGAVRCYIVNKQRNGMERFLAAPAPLVVDDENFVIADNGNVPDAAPPPAPIAPPAPEGNEATGFAHIAQLLGGLDRRFTEQTAVSDQRFAELTETLCSEIRPMAQDISDLNDKTKNLERKHSETQEEVSELRREIKALKSARISDNGATATVPRNGSSVVRSGVPLSVLESAGEIETVLGDLDPANPAANDGKLVEKVLSRSREVKLKNFRCSYGVPEEPQLILGDGNVLAVRKAGRTFKSVDEVLDAVEFFMQVLVVAGRVPAAAATAYKTNVRAHRFSISSPDILAEAHDRFRLKLIQKGSWDFAEGFAPSMAKEFEAICQSQKQQRDRFYSDPGTKGRSGPFRGKCFDCDKQGHRKGDPDFPKNHQKKDTGQFKKHFPGPSSTGGGNYTPRQGTCALQKPLNLELRN